MEKASLGVKGYTFPLSFSSKSWLALNSLLEILTINLIFCLLTPRLPIYLYSLMCIPPLTSDLPLPLGHCLPSLLSFLIPALPPQTLPASLSPSWSGPFRAALGDP